MLIMNLFKNVFFISLFLSFTYSICAQNTLKVYMLNRKHINKVKYCFGNAKYDSVYFYGNKILKTNDLTYIRPVYKYFARTALAQKDFEKCKKYWYRAVEYGLFWNRIDTNARKILSHKTYLLHHKKYKN